MIGLIFDMDGVIVDNHYYHFKAWKAFAAKYGKEITEEHYKATINGRTMKEIINGIFEGDDLSMETARNYGLEKEAIYREIYMDDLAPTTGLITFLKKAKEQNIKTIIGTSAPAENVTFTIGGLQLEKYFHGVLDESAVTKGKPHPEIYLKCAEQINLPNHQCVVFEDALAGIKAGKAAGSFVVGVATTHQKHELTEADHVIENFDELDLGKLQEMIL